MEPGDDQLAVLHRLQSEGQITATEYAHLAAGLTASGPSRAEAPAPDVPEPEEPNRELVEPDEDTDPAESVAGPNPLLPPQLRQDTSGTYVASIGVASLALVAAGATGLLSWFVASAAILLLVTTLLEGWRWVTVSGTVLVVAILLIGFVVSLGETPPTEPVVAATPASVEPDPDIPGSLGIHMEEVTDAWNTLEGEPRITKGLTRHNETGQYDTFIYRFGEWGRLAGAYDPETEAIYALLATGWLTEAPTAQLYLRLCFMVAPYSQECVDSYLAEGLGGVPLTDLEPPYQSEWRVGDHTWRLELEQSLLTIRVFGADA
ncbi:MAG TPA: hypothetical protein VFT85_06865 [Acidimicrobiia bacterium]|nr:hypothetical protein [Acidimicrobiia bacterium]